MSSWIGEGAVLCFFHAIVDKDQEQDNNTDTLTQWSNWCGPQMDNVADIYFTLEARQALGKVLYDLDMEARSAPGYKQNDSAPEGPQAPPHYVFQVLDSASGSLLFTYPPSQEPAEYPVGPDPGGHEPYLGSEYAKLAIEVWQKPREKNVDARTSCTKRFRSKHPMFVLLYMFLLHRSDELCRMKDGFLTTIDSVVVRYSALTFACFQRAETFTAHRTRSNSAASVGQLSASTNGLQASAYGRPVLPPIIPPTADLGLRISQNPVHTSPSLYGSAVLGKRLRGSDDDLQPPQLAPPRLLDPATRAWQLSQESIFTSLSPTVASSAAILDSFQHSSRPIAPQLNMYNQQQPHSPLTSNGSNEQYGRFAYDPLLMNFNYPGSQQHIQPPSHLNGSMPYPQYAPSPVDPLHPPEIYPASSQKRRSSDKGIDVKPASTNRGGGSVSARPAKQVKREHKAKATSVEGDGAESSTGNSDGVHRVCTSCGTSSSPEWRKGPMGIKTMW